jgi:methylmalonyl-CoA mutase
MPRINRSAGATYWEVARAFDPSITSGIIVIPRTFATMTDPTANQPLAADFPAASLEQWRALVDKALKGADYEKRLVARTADGLRIPPLYTRADQRTEAGLPGHAPFTRGTHETVDGFGWQILTLIDGGDAATANRDLLADLEGGANGIVLQTLAPGQSGVALQSAGDAALALSGVYLDLARVELKGGLTGLATARHVMGALPALAGKAGQRQLALNLDPIGNLARFGTAGAPIAAALTEAVAFAKTVRAAEPHAQTVLVDATIAHEAGASEAQELGVLAATLVAYLRAFEAAGVTPADALAHLNVHVAADTDIFLTASKIRAARTMIARIADASGAAHAAAGVRLTAITSARMMARRDPWTNMLRTTVATAGAAFGGVDGVCVLPFSHALGASDAFARRIARNTQIVAQEESHLGRVVDPAGGAWYVEQATAELAQKGWASFQELEAEGGIVAALQSGLIQGQIAAVAEQRAKSIATGKFELTGVSAFPLLGADGITVHPRQAAPAIEGALAVRPLAPVRLGAAFEALRDAADAAKVAPQVFLASLGEIADHTARSTWVKNMLASGGIASVASDGYASAEAVASAFKASGARVAVIASSDALYASLAEATARALKAAGASHVAMAGRPGDHEAAYRAAGVERFIFAGQDAVATLTELQRVIAG